MKPSDIDKTLQPQFPSNFTLKIIGLGGVGSIVADYVTLWLTAQAAQHPDVRMRIVLIDGDAFESNNTRMFFSELGDKAEVKRKDLLNRIGDRMTNVTIAAVNEYVTDQNIGQLIHEGDTVMLCVDSHPARKLVSEYFEQHIHDGVLISAGNDGAGPDSTGTILRGTYGNCQRFTRNAGVNTSPSLTKYHPEISQPAPNDKLRTEQSCTELVASGPQLLFANLWAASTALATLYMTLCGQADHLAEVVFDFAEGKVMPLNLPAEPQFEKSVNQSGENQDGTQAAEASETPGVQADPVHADAGTGG